MASPSNDPDLKEIREEYRYAVDEKKHIRDEGDTDMRFIAGDAWDPKDRLAREEAGRPCLSLDELNQYVNQLNNDVRQNKRSIKVAAAGAGSTDKTADLHRGLIRQIEYSSNAALDAYPIMFENAAQRSYGYLRIKPDYVNHRSFDQELRILPIPNPNMVTEDPNNLRPDGADWKFLYYAELWAKADVQRKWPKAKLESFDPEQARAASDWIKGERILIAERWRVTTKARKLLLIQMPSGGGAQPAPPQAIFEDELDLAKLPKQAKVIRSRSVDYPKVSQQIVNGLEILDEKDFPGTSIPFVGCYGKILYLDDGSGPKKHILSLIRLARDPQMLYNYYRTCEAEVVGRVPKVTPVGYKGQFDGHETEWQESYHIPKAYLEVNALTEATGQTVLPPPIMQTWEPPIQALEMGAEAARRAIQSAIGASPLPTQAQRHNEKSGVALKQIEDTAQKGSFHFVDHFDAALARTGAILDELIPHYYDAVRDVTVRKPDDQPSVIRINDPDKPDSVNATDGLHDVTISVGPRQLSEREAASDFADSILGSELLKLMGPEKALQIAALAIRLKSVGPLGDEMADILSPKPKEDGQPTPQQVQQMQQQVTELQKQLQDAAKAIETDQAKQQASIEMKKIDAQAQVTIAHMNNAAKIEVARITAAKEASNLVAEAAEERLSTGLELDHEAQQAEIDRQHEAAMAVMQAQHAAGAADQAHGQAIEQGQAASEQAMVQQANQAALEPPPEAAG